MNWPAELLGFLAATIATAAVMGLVVFISTLVSERRRRRRAAESLARAAADNLAQFQKRMGVLTSEQLDGATVAPPSDIWAASPGEFAARWNAMTSEERSSCVAAVRRDSERSLRCFQQDHEGQLDALWKHVESLHRDADIDYAHLAEKIRKRNAPPDVAMRPSAFTIATVLSELADALDAMAADDHQPGRNDHA